jgi:hypothetical protein
VVDGPSARCVGRLAVRHHSWRTSQAQVSARSQCTLSQTRRPHFRNNKKKDMQTPTTHDGVGRCNNICGEEEVAAPRLLATDTLGHKWQQQQAAARPWGVTTDRRALMRTLSSRNSLSASFTSAVSAAVRSSFVCLRNKFNCSAVAISLPPPRHPPTHSGGGDDAINRGLVAHNAMLPTRFNTSWPPWSRR